MVHHRIHHGEEFPHTGDQGHFLRLAGGTQALIEGTDDRVIPRRDDGRHIPRGPHDRPATPDRPFPAQGATLPIERGHPHESGNPFLIQPAHLRQVSQQRPRDHRPIPGTLCSFPLLHMANTQAISAPIRSIPIPPRTLSVPAIFLPKVCSWRSVSFVAL